MMMRDVGRAAGLSALLLSLLPMGCRGAGGFPARTKALAPPRAPGARRRLLHVRALRVLSPLSGRRFMYKVAEGRFVSDRYSRLPAEPETILTDGLVDRLSASGLFDPVSDAAGGAWGGRTLDGTVTAFHCDCTSRADPRAVIEVRFAVIEHGGAESRIVFQRAYGHSEKLAGDMPADLAAGWARAYGRVLDSLIDDLRALGAAGGGP
ncbi:MAG: ABC-type transport auxiliary lipoprotein family protein [Planctomycetota bacterium]|jgi:hypothetical protein